ncbi:MAG: dicarboxylate/amino acid:cation symporter [Saprospiraceae bacterium]
MKRFGINHHWLILISFLVAIPTGLFFGKQLQFLEYIGTAFIQLLKMVIVPLVTFSIINALARFEQTKELRRIGWKTLGYFMISSLVAILVGLLLFNIINPGLDVDLPVGTAEGLSLQINRPESLLDILVNIIPANPIEALAEMNMLSIIFFSTLFGIALTKINPKMREQFLGFSESAYEVMIVITNWVIALIPIGIFGLIIKAINQTDISFFKSVFWYIVTLGFGLLLLFFVIQPLFLFLFTRKNPIVHCRQMGDAIITALATSSSLATLPVTMKCVEQNAGVPKKITNFVVPLGATINMDASAMFEAIAALFIAQVLGFELGIAQQFIVMMTALLASIGAAGVPSAGIVVIFIVIEAIGIKGSAADFIIGVILAVDRPLDIMRTVINIYGDTIAAVVVWESERE